MTTTTRSFPPPPLPAAVTQGVGPLAFRSYRGATSGSRGTVFFDDRQPGAVTFTGEFYPPQKLNAFRVGQLLLSFAMLGSLFTALILTLSAGDSSTPPLAVVLLVLSMLAMIGLLVWKSVLVKSARATTLLVHPADISRVRATPNWNNLAWWLLIGPFALIIVFAGRRLLKAEVPVTVDGRAGRLTLVLHEQRAGDADLLATRLRMAGAR